MHHLRTAAELRATGDGPVDPWTMRDRWVMVRATGDVIALPDYLSQPQWDTLGDMLIAAPEGPYKSRLVDSIRTIQQLESSRPV
jgi:hypothetical protein